MIEHYVPGLWRCPKCGFTQQNSILYVGSGTIGSDKRPHIEPCPNDGRDMEPVTWKEQCKMISEVCETQIKRAVEAEENLKYEIKRLDWLDHHCSFVADREYNIGPFQVGELRRMADCGIAIDAARREP